VDFSLDCKYDYEERSERCEYIVYYYSYQSLPRPGDTFAQFQIFISGLQRQNVENVEAKQECHWQHDFLEDGSDFGASRGLILGI
jgi:hypothetical protein